MNGGLVIALRDYQIRERYQSSQQRGIGIMGLSEGQSQLSTVDFLTPIHKALRLMIYDVGSRLQTTDFSDSAQSQLLLNELIYEFSSALSASCILCLLHSHAKAEDLYLFPAVEKSDSKL